jgi:hypothetical protein
MTEEMDPRHNAEQTYPTESGREHPPAPPFPAPSSGQSANVPDPLQGPSVPEQYGGRPQPSAPPGAAAPERGDAATYSSPDSSRVRGPAVAQTDDVIRNEKQIVADSHAAFPDESMGQRFEWRGQGAAEAYAGELPHEAHGGRWRRTAVVLAGVVIGMFLLRRMRRQG